MYANDNFVNVEQAFSLALTADGMVCQERSFPPLRSAENANLSTSGWRHLPSANLSAEADLDTRWPFVLAEEPPLARTDLSMLEWLSDEYPGLMALARNIPAFLVLTACILMLMRLVG